jgi:hypothetical protein
MKSTIRDKVINETFKQFNDFFNSSKEFMCVRDFKHYHSYERFKNSIYPVYESRIFFEVLNFLELNDIIISGRAAYFKNINVHKNTSVVLKYDDSPDFIKLQKKFEREKQLYSIKKKLAQKQLGKSDGLKRIIVTREMKRGNKDYWSRDVILKISLKSSQTFEDFKASNSERKLIDRLKAYFRFNVVSIKLLKGDECIQYAIDKIYWNAANARFRLFN